MNLFDHAIATRILAIAFDEQAKGSPDLPDSKVVASIGRAYHRAASAMERHARAELAEAYQRDVMEP
jgi:hypothetical protein